MLNFPIVNELDIAIDVMLNTPSWLPIGDLPLRGEPAKEVKIQCLLGDQLIIEEFTQDLKKGFSYSYPATTKVQGLTAVSLCPKLLYRTMAPDQYFLPEFMSLSDEDIQSIDDLVLDTVVLENLKNYKFRCFNDNTYLELKNICFNISEAMLSKIVHKIETLIGSQHIRAIAAEISSDNQYCAITITEQRLSEAAGFNIPQNVNTFSVIEQSPSSVDININGQDAKIERVKIFSDYKHHPCLIEHMVIQSDRAIGNDKEFNLRLALDATDMPLLVRFFDRTIGKGLPVAINCTDGIDRTGILIVAFTMLYLYTQNDFTKLSQIQQQKFIKNLIEQLRVDGGPFFLRQEPDIARAVMLGYALIETKKSMSQDNVQQFGKLESVCRDFSLVNQDFKNSYINKLRNERVIVKYYKDKRFYIHEAPIELYITLIKKGLDIGHYEKNNKNIYRFAVLTFLSNPSIANLKSLKELLELGGQYAKSSMFLELIEQEYHENFINYLIKLMDDEKSRKSIKEDIRKEMSMLSSSVDREKYKSSFKSNLSTLNKRVKENKDEAMQKLLAKMKLTLPSTTLSKTYKSETKESTTSTSTSTLDSILLTPSNSSSISSGYSSDSVPSNVLTFSYPGSGSSNILSLEKSAIIEDKTEIPKKSGIMKPLIRSSTVEEVREKDKKKASNFLSNFERLTIEEKPEKSGKWRNSEKSGKMVRSRTVEVVGTKDKKKTNSLLNSFEKLAIIEEKPEKSGTMQTLTRSSSVEETETKDKEAKDTKDRKKRNSYQGF